MSNSFAIPWTIAHHVPLSIGFPREEYRSGLPFPSPGDLPNPGIKLASPAWHADSLLLSHQGSPILYIIHIIFVYNMYVIYVYTIYAYVDNINNIYIYNIYMCIMYTLCIIYIFIHTHAYIYIYLCNIYIK